MQQRGCAHVLCLLLISSACSTITYDSESSWAAPLRVGMDMEQVKRILGPPVETWCAGAIWACRVREEEHGNFLLGMLLFFDHVSMPNGVLVDGLVAWGEVYGTKDALSFFSIRDASIDPSMRSAEPGTRLQEMTPFRDMRIIASPGKPTQVGR